MEPLRLDDGALLAQFRECLEALQKDEKRAILEADWPAADIVIRAILSWPHTTTNVGTFLTPLATLSLSDKLIGKWKPGSNVDAIYQIFYEMGCIFLSYMESLPPPPNVYRQRSYMEQQKHLHDYFNLLPLQYQNLVRSRLEAMQSKRDEMQARVRETYDEESVEPLTDQQQVLIRDLTETVLDSYGVSDINLSGLNPAEYTRFFNEDPRTKTVMPQLQEPEIFRKQWSFSFIFGLMNDTESRSQLQLIIENPAEYLRQLHNHVAKFWWRIPLMQQSDIAKILHALASINFIPHKLEESFFVPSPLEHSLVPSLEPLRHETYLSAVNSEFLRQKLADCDFSVRPTTIFGQRYYSTTLYYIYEYINPIWIKICEAKTESERRVLVTELTNLIRTSFGISINFSDLHEQDCTITYDLEYVRKYAVLMKISSYNLFKIFLNKNVSGVTTALGCSEEEANRMLTELSTTAPQPKISECNSPIYSILEGHGYFLDKSIVEIIGDCPFQKQFERLTQKIGDLPVCLTQPNVFNQNWNRADQGLLGGALRDSKSPLEIVLMDQERYLKLLHNHISKFWWNIPDGDNRLRRIASILAILANNQFLHPDLIKELAVVPFGYSLQQLRTNTYRSALNAEWLRQLLDREGYTFKHKRIGLRNVMGSRSYFSTTLYYIYTYINPVWKRVCESSDATKRAQAIKELVDNMDNCFCNINKGLLLEKASQLGDHEFITVCDINFCVTHAALTKISEYALFVAFFNGDAKTISEKTGLNGEILLTQYQEYQKEEEEKVARSESHQASLEQSIDDEDDGDKRSTKPQI